MDRKNKDINVKKPTFCILPWIHLQTKPNGQVKPCCRFDHTHKDYKTDQGYIWNQYNVNTHSFEEIITSDTWQQLRSDMLENKKISGCWKCYKDESKNTRSMRNGENDIWFRDLPDENFLSLRYYEFALGSFCNLKCRTCDASLSHTWKDDNEKLVPFYKDRLPYKDNTNLNTYYKKEDFSNVENIKFTGGEPMLHPNFSDIIDHIIEMGRAPYVNLNIFTNASWMPKNSLVVKLKKFKKITISLSIDGIGKVNDYIRHPSNWAEVESVTRRWLSTEFDVVWHPTFNIYNIWQCTQMVDWWVSIQQEVKGLDFWSNNTRITEVPPRKNLLRVLPTQIRRLNMVSNVVVDPSYLSCALYPDKDTTHIKQKQKDFLEKLEEHSFSDFEKESLTFAINKFFNSISKALTKDVDNDAVKLFGSYTTDLDMLRNENLSKTMPDLFNKFPVEIFQGKL